MFVLTRITVVLGAAHAAPLGNAVFPLVFTRVPSEERLCPVGALSGIVFGRVARFHGPGLFPNGFLRILVNHVPNRDVLFLAQQKHCVL